MNKWPTVTLGEVLVPISPSPYTPAQDELVSLAGVRWYGEGLFVRETRLGVNVPGKVFKLQPGCVIYNRLFAWKQAFAVVGAEYEGVLVSNEFPQFVVNAKQAVAEFVALCCSSAGFARKALSLSSGSAAVSRNRLKEKDLLTLEIALPPIKEQRRIVTLVTQVDDLVLALQAEADAAEGARRGLVHDLFSNTESWREEKLGTQVAFASGSAFPHKYQGGDTGVPFIKVGDMNLEGNEVYIHTSRNYVSESALVEMKAKKHPAGTVVFPKIGAAVATEKRRILAIPSAIDNNVMGVIPSDPITSEFLHVALQEIAFGELAKGGPVPSLNMTKVGSVRVAFPDREEQARIVSVSRALDDEVIALRGELRELQRLRISLVGALLEGTSAGSILA